MASTRLANGASGLAMRPVNDAGASTAMQSSNLQGLRYAQTGRKETSSAAHSGKSIGKRKGRRSVSCRQSPENNLVQASSLLALSLISLPKKSRMTVYVTVICLRCSTHTACMLPATSKTKRKGRTCAGGPKLCCVN
jgi:hypothetical protein